ncbi:hypothetical protein V7S43_015110 [Phytophthora oleae]|uniref:Uncharacterized protein n=1 Tax=Phytophthora oleae TaxID=2107226 RepID=A0ABD3EZ27_9STRA
MAPFEADLGYLPSTPATLLSQPDATRAERQRQVTGKTFLELHADCFDTVRRELQQSSDRMSTYYDKNRPEHTSEVEEEVLTSTKTLRTSTLGSQKQSLKLVGLGRIVLSSASVMTTKDYGVQKV